MTRYYKEKDQSEAAGAQNADDVGASADLSNEALTIRDAEHAACVEANSAALTAYLARMGALPESSCT